MSVIQAGIHSNNSHSMNPGAKRTTPTEDLDVLLRKSLLPYLMYMRAMAAILRLRGRDCWEGSGGGHATMPWRMEVDILILALKPVAIGHRWMERMDTRYELTNKRWEKQYVKMPLGSLACYTNRSLVNGRSGAGNNLGHMVVAGHERVDVLMKFGAKRQYSGSGSAIGTSISYKNEHRRR